MQIWKELYDEADIEILTMKHIAIWFRSRTERITTIKSKIHVLQSHNRSLFYIDDVLFTIHEYLYFWIVLYGVLLGSVAGINQAWFQLRTLSGVDNAHMAVVYWWFLISYRHSVAPCKALAVTHWSFLIIILVSCSTPVRTVKKCCGSVWFGFTCYRTLQTSGAKVDDVLARCL